MYPVTLFLAAWLALTGAAAGEARRAELPVATAARLAGDGERTRFVADLSGPVGFRVYALAEPYRVIVDLPEIEFRLPVELGRQGRGMVSEYRFGQFERNRSRIVFDLTGPALIEKSFLVAPQNGQPARLVIDLVRSDPASFLSRAAQPAPSGPASAPAAVPDARPAAEPEPPSAPAPGAPMPAAPAPKAERAGAIAGAAVPRPRAKPVGEPQSADRAPVSLLSKAVEVKPHEASEPKAERAAPPRPAKATRVVVIDPGHGGIDPGAIGRDGTAEKDVVLAFAEALRDALLAGGRYQVLLTRNGDTFMSLGERVRFARRHDADLFIAVHADSIRGAVVRGATIYTLSEQASDLEAEALAATENRADLIAGVELGEESEEVTGILVDLARRETKNHAVAFAKTVVGKLGGVTPLTRMPHRFAGFRVLKAPDVPSVLLELGYLSNPREAAQLRSPAWRSKVSAALMHAVDGYFTTRLSAK